MQHTSIDVYGYVKARTKMSKKRGLFYLLLPGALARDEAALLRRTEPIFGWAGSAAAVPPNT